MANCGVHGTDIPLPALRIEPFPVNSTSKYQPLDLGLTAHSKIRYRSLLLQKVVENVFHRPSSEHEFPAHLHSGKFGLRDGQTFHVGDAMALFNDCRPKTERKTILKCWMRNKCLYNLQVQECEQMIAHDNTHVVAVDQDEAARIYDDIFVQGLVSSGEVSEKVLLQELEGVESAIQLYDALNAPVSDDISIDRAEIAEVQLKSLLDAQCDESNAPITQSRSVVSTDTEPSGAQLCEMIQKKSQAHPAIGNDLEVVDACLNAFRHMKDLE